MARHAEFTVRERILQQWQKNLSQLTTLNGDILFESVHRARVNPNSSAGRRFAGLIDMGEAAGVYEVGYIENNMRVAVEIAVRMDVGDNPSKELNNCVGLITREFLSKIETYEEGSGDALSLNIRSVSLEFDVDGDTDKLVMCVAIFEIIYRHHKQDPYDLR